MFSCDCYRAIVEMIQLCEKKNSGSFKKCVYKSYIYLIYMYKLDLALNNLQLLICHKTQPNQIIYIFDIYIQAGFGIE